MGVNGSDRVIGQTGFSLTPTSSVYTFLTAGIELTVSFTSPLLLTEPELLSRPCGYIGFGAVSADGSPHEVKISLDIDGSLCYFQNWGEAPKMTGEEYDFGGFRAARMGKANQALLSHSGDYTSADWGYAYAAVPADSPASVAYGGGKLKVSLNFGSVREKIDDFIVLAYDDVASVMYFGEAVRGYWARNGKTIFEAIGEAVSEHDAVIAKCDAFDVSLIGEAAEAAGDEYALICALSYRQSVAAHKLIADGSGSLVFLSKECGSNGCIGTVDVSYPSAPLFLKYNPEFLKGMLRPVFRFAGRGVWEHDFAPHDVGRYPYATGQVYGLWGDRHADIGPFSVYPFYYQYPPGTDLYREVFQMPVEECGNMLIMTAAAVMKDNDAEFIRENIGLLEKWAEYLVKHGADPGDQLCTDDFAGHLAHNVNLAAKAIMGIAAYSIILGKLERRGEADRYMGIAREMAGKWEKDSAADGRSFLTFEPRDGWSLKYNLVWDKVFKTGLFSQEVFDNEIKHYLKMGEMHRYGVPLDNRESYTKTDWLVWGAFLAEDREDTKKLLSPLYRFIGETPDRVPFTDLYYVGDGRPVFWGGTQHTGSRYCFRNRTVVGGVFMGLLV